MDTLFRTESYHFAPLSVPFLVGAAAVLAVFVYAALVRGAPLVRAGVLVFSGALLPFLSAASLAASTVEPRAAELVWRGAISLLPLAGAGGMLFVLALVGRAVVYRRLLVVVFAISVAMAAVTLTTDFVVRGVWHMPTGMYYFLAGPLHPLQGAMLLSWSGIGLWLGWRQQRTESSALRRSQYRNALIAMSVCAFGLIDLRLARGAGWFPFAWAFLATGAVLALRCLVIDDVIRIRALDRRAPLFALHATAVVVSLWLIERFLAPTVPAPVILVVILGVYCTVRLVVVILEEVFGGTRSTDTPLARLLGQYGARSQALRNEAEIGILVGELVQLGIGGKLELLLPSEGDYSWQRAGGALVAERETPDPLLLSWMLAHAAPIQRDDLQTLRLGDLRAPLERLFEAQGAEVIVPLINRDEIVGLLVIRDVPGGRALRRDELEFLTRLDDSVAQSLVYTRMSRQAAGRVEVDKQVELAAVVQRAFVPSAEPIDLGAVEVCGTYTPATQCGGDWWSVHRLTPSRVLVLVGDVTGHGVAAAMVTAAAKGCYDVAERLMGDDFDLVRLLELLDAAVRRAGGRKFHMTCFATLIDVDAGRISFANAGHVLPYLVRPREGGVDLQALVVRGNPLGAGESQRYSAASHDLVAGDMLVWYTDGLVEAAGRDGKHFGDRRMQRLLRQADGRTTSVGTLRDALVSAVQAHQDGRPLADDLTLVVGRIKPPAPPAAGSSPATPPP